ncbi:MAG: hypothetical protein F4X26_01720 [Chloroflexi bacterium]|nr:hypothetical protein [Chloroflexota bacterium]
MPEPYRLRGPSEETEDMYLAEARAFEGCRAWGATAEEALWNLEGVVADYIASCEQHGDPLPATVAAVESTRLDRCSFDEA